MEVTDGVVKERAGSPKDEDVPARAPVTKADLLGEAAAEAFLSTYLHRLAERGESTATCAGIAGRARVFEAALLLKIAARRANRLHSPRPGEVAAVLDEVSRTLASAGPP